MKFYLAKPNSLNFLGRRGKSEKEVTVNSTRIFVSHQLNCYRLPRNDSTNHDDAANNHDSTNHDDTASPDGTLWHTACFHAQFCL